MFSLSGSAEQNCSFISFKLSWTPVSSQLWHRFRGLESHCQWLLNHLISQNRQTWMSFSIPPSTFRSRIKDRPSFTSRTSSDYNRLSRTAEAPHPGFSWLPTTRSVTESCLKLRYVQNPASFWPAAPRPRPLTFSAIISLIPVMFDFLTFFGFNFSYSS